MKLLEFVLSFFLSSSSTSPRNNGYVMSWELMLKEFTAGQGSPSAVSQPLEMFLQASIKFDFGSLAFITVLSEQQKIVFAMLSSQTRRILRCDLRVAQIIQVYFPVPDNAENRQIIEDMPSWTVNSFGRDVTVMLANSSVLRIDAESGTVELRLDCAVDLSTGLLVVNASEVLELPQRVTMRLPAQLLITAGSTADIRVDRARPRSPELLSSHKSPRVSEGVR